jgi:hypothetical protein
MEFARNLAFIIGINNYQNSIRELKIVVPVIIGINYWICLV